MRNLVALVLELPHAEVPFTKRWRARQLAEGCQSALAFAKVDATICDEAKIATEYLSDVRSKPVLVFFFGGMIERARNAKLANPQFRVVVLTDDPNLDTMGREEGGIFITHWARLNSPANVIRLLLGVNPSETPFGPVTEMPLCSVELELKLRVAAQRRNLSPEEFLVKVVGFFDSHSQRRG